MEIKFGKKMSIAAAKVLWSTDKLDIVRNPKNGNLFVVANGETVAAVSKNYDKSLDKEFVEIISADGSTLWCLHNPANTNVEETL